jgi:hypothetical protein
LYLAVLAKWTSIKEGNHTGILSTLKGMMTTSDLHLILGAFPTKGANLPSSADIE